MRWPDAAFSISIVAAIVAFVFLVEQCQENSAKVKLECLKAGRMEAECRFGP